MEPVNGKVYPMWGQFLDRKEEWIGGTLEDHGDSMDRQMKMPVMSTKITDIQIRPNGKDSAMFGVIGEHFECASDVRYLGVTAGEEGWITLSGMFGHIWRFKKAG